VCLRRTSAAIAGASLLAWTGPCFAAPSAVPLAAYQAGRFIEAADAAARLPGPDDRALAARALIAECVVTAPNCDIDLVDRAQDNALAALAADPTNVEARLQLAMAIGIKGRRAGLAEALRFNYAGQGKRLVDQAVTLAPDEPWAWALLGGWNLEIVRRGGRIGGRFYGASIAKGAAAFDRARALAPDDPAIGLHYAAALLGIDPIRYADRARAILAAASNAPAPDAFSRRMRDEARRVALVMADQGPAAAAAQAQSRL